MCQSHVYGVKTCPQKSRLVKSGDWIHSAMIAIDSYIYDMNWTEKNMVQTD